jgi:amino acid adenylation domain-containing protein
MDMTKETDAKRALLEQYLQQRTRRTSPPQTIPHHTGEGPFPLSFGQQQLWLLSHVMQDVPVYSECVTIHLPGELDVAALERSFLEVVRRQTTLRTSFPAPDGEPTQVLHPSPLTTLPVADLRHLPPAEREAEATRLATAEALAPFDLAHGPLMRATLVHLSDTAHRLYIAMHHMIFDGVSIHQILLPELRTLYEAFTQGQPSPLPELTHHYADYALWQRAMVQEGAMADHLAYWQRQLAGAPATLDLPTDRPSPPAPSYSGEMYPFALSHELTDQLKALAQREGVSLYMLLLAATNILFYRYSGQEDILIGTPMSSRNRLEWQQIMGYFLNTLVIRTDLTGAPSIHDVLQRVRDAVLDAHAHQDAPFELVVRAVQPERIPGRNPLFQVMMSLEPPLPTLASGWTVTQMDVETATAKFDLNIELDERPTGLIGRFEYSTDLFEHETVGRMVQHWIAILTSAVADVTQPIATLPMLTPAEYHQILTDWNATTTAMTPEPVHHLFEAQAARLPAATALVYEEQVLTYAELNRRANQLAHHLRHLGVGPDQLVGLCVERSPEMIVGLLGILKAGGAYAPLDPTFPPDRIAYMLREAGARVVVTQKHLAATLPVGDYLVITLDGDWATIRHQPEHNPQVDVRPEHLAYVIFTSGSTGAPKGTMIEHRQLFNYVQGVGQRLALPAGASFATVSTIAADLGNTGVYLALTQGGTLHIIAQERLLDADAFAAYMHDHAIDCVKLTPSHMAAILTAAHPAWALPRRAVVMGGEFSHWSLINQLREIAPDLRIINHYGPTETTVGVATYEVPDGAALVAKTVPIGRPLANSRLYILDRHQQPVPIGVPGELYIGGAGVARGYLHRPDLTAERFIVHPLSNDPQDRLYRTGDLAHWLPDGTVELLGRQDNQVKIRGFRVELGEIEVALRAHPGIAQACVLAREDIPGDKRLVAYIVPVAGTDADPSGYQELLRAKLPEYMLPTAYVPLDALPLTPNGKIDTRALPLPDAAQAAIGTPYAPPRTLTEELLVSIWADVLGVAQVGIHDNFFTLGGHSLLATRVVTRVRQTLGNDMSLRLLFEAPTIAELAEHLDHQGPYAALPKITPHDRAAYLQSDGSYVFPPSYMEESLWFLYQLDPASPVYNIPISARLRGPLDMALLARVLAEVARRHEIVRTRFATRDGQLVQVVLPAVAIPLEEVNLSLIGPAEQEAEAVRLTMAFTRQPFDLERDALLRVQVLHLQPAEHIITFLTQHTISDGTSLNILLAEVATLYRDFAQGRAASLPELPIQYADYALWQREALRDGRLEGQVDFWRDHLRNAPTTLNLPTDHPRPAEQSFAGAQHVFTLPPELMQRLRALSRRENATLFMTLMASMSALFAQYSGQEELLLGSPIGGRNQLETERLLGVFINSITLRCDVSGNPTFRELVGRVRQETLHVMANQDVPFDYLVQRLRPERLPGQNPFFQVMLSYWDIEPLAEGWEPTLLDISGDAAKFDFYIEMDDQPEGCVCHCEYSTDLFEATTVARMMTHWQRILVAIASDPAVHVAELPLLTEVERQTMLVDWNATERAFPTASVQHLIHTQARRTPDAVAVAFGDRTLTYAELDHQSQQLAVTLMQAGTQPGDLVGLYIDRSLAMVVGLLGILKAGAAYVPLDPAFPADRLAYMVGDAGARFVVTSHALMATLPPGAAQAILIEDALAAPLVAPATLPDVAPDALAYVIYTSGSTGRPKGVQIAQGALVNLLTSMAHAPGLTADDTLLAVTTLSFDIAALEIFLPLMQGARLVIVPREVAVDGEALMQAMQATRATVMQATPTTWRLLLAAGWPGDPRLKVLCGGEPLPSDLAEALLPRVGSLWNMYGPTETTIWSTTCKITDPAQITIGGPIDNTAIYILDAYAHPVPIGVPGEMHIGGVGLARGYLHRPDLTAERFIAHPFSDDPTARIYKTGDLGCWLPNGEIRHLGRMDQQVKIRGYRIELGEIEAVLAQHPDLREAAVVAREDAPGNPQLVAYYVAEGGQTIATAALRTHLQTQLPPYMVPAVYVALAALPLTPNGKIDRRALPVPEGAATHPQGGYVAPTTATEQRLVAIWEALLPTRPIGITDNFFEIGGHSLLAAQMVQQIDTAFGQKIRLASLFRGATIAHLATWLTTPRPVALPTNERTTLVPVQPDGTRPPFFYVPADWNGGGFYAREIARDLGPDQPFYVLDPQAYHPTEAPATLAAMAALHLRSLRAVQPEGPYHLGGFCIGGLIAYEMARQLQMAGQTVATLVMIDAAATRPRMRLAHDLVARDRRLTPAQQHARYLRLRDLNTLADRVEIRGWQLVTGQWQRLRQREELPPEHLALVDQSLAHQWMAWYTWAAAGYVPGPYAGKVTLLWAREDLADSPVNRRHEWQRRTQGVTFHTIPGTHLSCVIDHVHDLAARFKASLTDEGGRT